MRRSMALKFRAATACALAAGLHGAVAQPTISGDVLTTREGLTLYVFDNDVTGSGRSICNAPCSGLHPPYLVEEGATVKEPLGLVMRDDGTRQWSYKGRPLYRFYADDQAGDAKGDGLNRGTWHIAKP